MCFKPAFADRFKTILGRYTEADAAVLACTELPLIIDEHNSPIPLIDLMECQCKAAAAYAYQPMVPLRQMPASNVEVSASPHMG